MAMVATGPMPGKTNQGAQQATDESVNQVLESESHSKTEGEVVDQIIHE